MNNKLLNLDSINEPKSSSEVINIIMNKYYIDREACESEVKKLNEFSLIYN